MTPTDAKEYTLELLRSNPRVSAQQIIQRRARYLGIEQAPQQAAGGDVDSSERRHRAEEALSKIRAEFWTVAAAEIESRLTAQSFDGLPDLAVSAARLKRVAQAAAEFSRLAAERGVSKSFVEALRQIVVLPPAEAGKMKQWQEQTLVRLGTLRSAKRTARLIAAKYAQIHELEDEWLDHVASFRRGRPIPVQREKKSQGSLLGYLIFGFIIILFRILRMLAEK